MIRTAILGYGRNGSTMHANPLEKDESFEVVAVCDIEPEARKKAEERFRCPVYEDYHQMLKEEQLDLVVVVTRSYQHAQMAIDCLLAGCNVLVTKPWATNAFDAERMIAAQKVSGRKLLPWLPARFGADLRELKKIIDRGDIGRVFEIRRSTGTFGIRFDWQTEHKYGGGYLLNWGPHLIDQPLQLTDSPVQYVYGNLRQIINPGDGEDNLRVICHLENGVTIVSEYLVMTGNYPTWVIQGDKGTIYVYDHEIHVYQVKRPDQADKTAYRSDVEISDYTVQVEGSIYGDEFEIYKHIARVIRDEEPYFVTLDSALRLSRILEAARQSSIQRQEVFLTDGKN